MKKQITDIDSFTLSKAEVMSYIDQISDIMCEDKKKFKDQLETLDALRLFVMFRSDKDIQDMFRGIIWFTDQIRYKNVLQKDEILKELKHTFMMDKKTVTQELFSQF